jgi:hypothetical protein
MERKFSFDDMTFVARAEQAGDVLRVGIYDAWDDCRLEANYPAAGKSKGKAKGKAAASTTATSAQEQAIDDLIASFKRKVETGEISLA